MAFVRANIITKGLSGMLGKMLVFRKTRDKTVAYSYTRSKKKRSAEQRVQQNRFKLAMAYAKAQMADPIVRMEYEAAAKLLKMPNAYNVAVADFFHAPEIWRVDADSYMRNVHDVIKIVVMDDFKVASVKVRLEDEDGELLEEGNASISNNKTEWFYTGVMNQDITGRLKIIVKAKDMPGNETVHVLMTEV
jgi:hypothetical protein